MKIDDVFHGAESRAYYLNGDFAKLERAILRYSLSHLLSNGFKLISVPDVITNNVVNSCGFTNDPNKNQVIINVKLIILMNNLKME